MTPDGLEIRDGAVVHERRDDVYPGKATESAALDISHDGERYWLVLEGTPAAAACSSTRPEDGLFDTFDAFIRPDRRRRDDQPNGRWAAVQYADR